MTHSQPLRGLPQWSGACPVRARGGYSVVLFRWNVYA